MLILIEDSKTGSLSFGFSLMAILFDNASLWNAIYQQYVFNLLAFLAFPY